jgi:predicted nucleic acid-binding protein
MSSILVDTGVWYAMFDTSDRVRERKAIESLASRIDAMSIIVPWPVVYETLRTKFVRIAWQWAFLKSG